MLLCAVGIILTWLVSILLAIYAKDTCVYKVLKLFGKESMAIYLLSYFVQTPAVTVYGKVGNLGIPYLIWVMGLAVGAVVFAMLALKYVIRRSQLLSKLMIGE
jgi:uncharacterized membrane protein YciS (DUF1049 family)